MATADGKLLLDSAPHVQRVVDQVAAANGFSNPRLEVSHGSSIGDNYIGLLYRVNISDGEDASRPPLDVIVKSVPMSAKRREMCQTERIFKNEGTMYEEVFPAFARLLRGRGLLAEGDGYPDAPKCHLVSVGQSDGSEDVLVLEDMKPQGFAMQDRQRGLDAEHCRLVLGALARMHACSFAMQLSRPEEFDKLSHSINEILFYSDSPMKDFLTPLAGRGFGMIIERFPEGTPGHQAAKRFLDNYLDKLVEAVSPSPDGGNVICHGDCWTNNLLFKHSEGKPEAVSMIDFQVARFCPPVLDLLYFLYTCTEREMRVEHLGALLRGYHADLQSRMRELGVEDPDAAYSWQRLQRDLRQRGCFGFGMAVFAIALFLSEKEEIPDMDAMFEDVDPKELMKDPEAMMEKWQVGQRRSHAINKRVSDVLEEMVELGYM